MALQFKQMLLKVDHALSTEDVQALVFLCADLLGKDVSRIATAQDLFKQLEELDCLTEDCQSLLAELLIVAKRNDLVRQLSLCQNSQCLVSPYRKMLFSLAENITTEDLKSIKFLLSQHLPRRKLEDNITTLGLFLELERMDKLSQTKLETLEQIVTSVCPSLRRKITQFKEKNGPGVQSTGSSYMSVRPAQQEQSPSYQPESLPCLISSHAGYPQQENANEEMQCETGSRDDVPISQYCNQQPSASSQDHASLHEQLSASLSLETPDAGTEAASLSLSQTCSVGVTDQFSSVQSHNLHFTSACEEKNQNQTEPFPERQSKIDAYQMKDDRRRGYCLIINNHDFTKSTKCLKNRDGTEVDEKSLKLVFDWLGFKTQIEPDCSVQRMLSLMEELSRRDHSRMDCLVVCVLSHGDRDLVYGVDGRKVNLGELKKPFSGARCRSLVGKPKLFFIQACQGQAEQLPVHIEADSPDLSTDAIVPQGSIPDDADFLLGMATVPNFASFRDRKQGTWFIQSLCQNLLEMVPSGHDLVTILTKVNNHVSRMTDRAGTRKQMPQPSFTLRKIIVFPVPKTPPPMLKVLTAVISQADNPNSHYEASSLGRDTPL